MSEQLEKRRGMKPSITQWTGLTLVAVAASALVTLGDAASRGDAVSGEAYGVFASTLIGSQDKTPHAVVPAGGGMGAGEALAVSAAGLVRAENLFSLATGGGDENAATAEAISTAEDVNILDGLITAKGVSAVVSSTLRETTAVSNAEGSQFANLVVNGVAIDEEVPPNTRIDIPGVGTVVLNQQIRSGDGEQSTGLTVNMISVILKNALTGATTGEIVVGSASTFVSR
jgi:hypothetical protein